MDYVQAQSIVLPVLSSAKCNKHDSVMLIAGSESDVLRFAIYISPIEHGTVINLSGSF